MARQAGRTGSSASSSRAGARPALADAPGAAVLDEAALEAALGRLQEADPAVIGHMLMVAGRPPLRRREPGFAGLAAIIVSQQLSTASAAAIFGRLQAALAPLEPAALLAASDEQLRGLGLSVGKVRTLRALATAATGGGLALDRLGAMPAEEAHAALVAIHGIGPWTADAFLLFCLGHPDAFPAGDLALQEAARVALGVEARPGAAALTVLAERWRPHRGVAARLLWAYYHAVKQGRSGMMLASP